MTSTKLVVSTDIIVSFPAGSIRITVPSQNKRYRASVRDLEFICAITDHTNQKLQNLRRRYTEESLEKALGLLLERGILSHEGDVGSRMPSEWQDWGEAAWLLQMKSSRARYVTTASEQLSAIAEIVATDPPPMYKCLCPNGSLDLLPPREISAELSKVLQQRRTCRDFADAPVSKSDLGSILYFTAGTLLTHETNYFGPVARKCAPSPGARHATEAYVAIRSCNDVPEGLYHYCSVHHRLAAITTPLPSEFLDNVLFRQHYFSAAAVTVLFTAVVNRIMWKYRNARAYRLMHYEVAHYAHNLLLAGTGLGLGVFVTGAIDDEYLEKQLDIDGVAEIPMYAAGFGPEIPDPVSHREGIQVSNFALPGQVRLPAPAPELTVDIPDTVEGILGEQQP